MTDRPIIMSGPMIRAILSGSKSQTRRVLRPQPVVPFSTFADYIEDEPNGDSGPPRRIRLPYASGDRLWCRETWAMPRWASRITLHVTDVRVQRLQEISEEDAEAEGVFRHVAEYSLDKVFRSERGATAIRYFRDLWDSLNAKRGFGWDENPWVTAITFDPELRNIDAPEVRHGD